jgi:hypothetical protein
MVATTLYHLLPVHESREGRAPEWFEVEGFKAAIEPDFDSWRVLTYSVELPTAERPSGRVVCELRHLPNVRIAVHLSVKTGELIGLEVGDPALFRHGDGEPQPISARLLRRIPFGELERSARESLKWELATRFHSENAGVRASLGDGGQQLRESLRVDPHPGKRGRQDVIYASLAAEYVERLASSEHPVKDIASDWDYSESRVRNMLSEARRRGLLTRPASGLAGGQLTSRAKELLRERGTDGDSEA